MLETTSVSAGGRVLTTVVKVFDLIIDGREATLPRLCQKISEARYGWGAGLPSQEKKRSRLFGKAKFVDCIFNITSS